MTLIERIYILIYYIINIIDSLIGLFTLGFIYSKMSANWICFYSRIELNKKIKKEKDLMDNGV